MKKKIYNYIIILLLIFVSLNLLFNYIMKENSCYLENETPIVYKTDPKFGRGVFATRNIKDKEKIEISPTIEVEKVDGILKNYIFGKSGKQYVAFGCGSMFNHSDDPNVDWAFNEKNDILFVANQPINKGEQLMINYGAFYWTSRSDKKI
jgi:SET domain-containing protein